MEGVIFIYKFHETLEMSLAKAYISHVVVPVHSRVGLGKDPNDCLRGSKHARKTHNKNKTSRGFLELICFFPPYMLKIICLKFIGLLGFFFSTYIVTNHYGKCSNIILKTKNPNDITTLY
jgi:hypothetical protein